MNLINTCRNISLHSEEILFNWQQEIVYRFAIDWRCSFLDAIASTSTYPCQSVSEWVSQWVIVSDLEIAIASPSFASLLLQIRYNMDIYFIACPTGYWVYHCLANNTINEMLSFYVSIFFTLNLKVQDENENFLLRISEFETRTRFFSQHLRVQDESEIFSLNISGFETRVRYFLSKSHVSRWERDMQTNFSRSSDKK